MTKSPSNASRAQDHHHRGLAELDRYLFHFEDPALPRAVDAFRRATELAPGDAAHWTALGFCLDASDLPADALAALQSAHEVDPADHEVEVFILTLLAELGPESEAMAAVEGLAGRSGVDLETLRRDLTAAEMPVDARALLMNGFIRARNFLRSRLQDAIDRSQRQRAHRAAAREAEAELRECDEAQSALQAEVDPERVPTGLGELTPWAVRLGVGDDVCRGVLAERLSPDERAALLGLVETQATSVHQWLDTFADGAMTSEAAAFMYLLLTVEEMEAGPS